MLLFVILQLATPYLPPAGVAACSMEFSSRKCVESPIPKSLVRVMWRAGQSRPGYARLSFYLDDAGHPEGITVIDASSDSFGGDASKHFRVSMYYRPCDATSNTQFLVELKNIDGQLVYSEVERLGERDRSAESVETDA